MLLLATSLGQLELVGAIVGAAFAAGVPAYRAAKQTTRSVDTVGQANQDAHTTLFELIGDVVHSVEGLRDDANDHDDRNQAEFRAIRERLDKIEAIDVAVSSRLDHIEGRLDHVEHQLDAG